MEIFSIITRTSCTRGCYFCFRVFGVCSSKQLFCCQVRLSPALKVYATLSRPDGVREGSMPYTAWKCMTQGSGSYDDITFLHGLMHFT